MKNIFFLIVCLVSVISYSQDKLELTPKGFINGEKDYIVLEFPNHKADKLFQKAKIYLSSMYKNPSKVLSEVDNKMINVSGYSSNSIRRNSMHVFDMNYNVIFHFKDNKIKVDAPTFKLTKSTKKNQTLHLNWSKFSLGGENLGIYGRKERLKSKKAKKDLEAFFNNYIQKFKESLDSNQDDW